MLKMNRYFKHVAPFLNLKIRCKGKNINMKINDNKAG